MAERCTSDFSRQRAVVVSNPATTMIDAVMAAISNMGYGSDEADLKRVLVQLDQLRNRGGISPRTRDDICRAATDARRSIVSGDTALAVDRLHDLAAKLGGST